MKFLKLLVLHTKHAWLKLRHNDERVCFSAIVFCPCRPITVASGKVATKQLMAGVWEVSTNDYIDQVRFISPGITRVELVKTDTIKYAGYMFFHLPTLSIIVGELPNCIHAPSIVKYCKSLERPLGLDNIDLDI